VQINKVNEIMEKMPKLIMNFGTNTKFVLTLAPRAVQQKNIIGALICDM
jgi:hypothetical protein